MIKHFKVFDSEADYSAYTLNSGYVTPNISIVSDDSGIVDYDVVYYNPRNTYLTFKILTGGTIVWEASNSAYTKTISYSVDNGITWSSITSNVESSAPYFSVNAGDKVMFKGLNSAYGLSSASTFSWNTFSGSTAIYNLEGNIMSMIYGDNFRDSTALTSTYVFFHLFSDSNVINACNLMLPSTTLSFACYTLMFNGCVRLKSTPLLPAKTLGAWCYQYMFSGCTSLEVAPELPATVLAEFCYRQMFVSCTGLTSSPVLPATQLVRQCYYQMFSACTNLEDITCLATDISAKECLSDWVDGVSPTGTFIKDASTTWPSGSSGIPSGWEIINKT